MRDKRNTAGLGFHLAVLLMAATSADASPNPQKVFLGFDTRYELTAAGGREEVLRVVPDSPAAKAGIREGDWILGFGGRRHTAQSLSEHIDTLGWIEPKQPLKVSLLRDGKELSLVLVPELAEPGQQAALIRYLEECRRLPEGCNDLCQSEEIEEPFKLRDLVSTHGKIELLFGKDAQSGEPILLKINPAPPKTWDFRRDPLFASGEMLQSIRTFLKTQPEVGAVYQQKEPGKFSFALKL